MRKHFDCRLALLALLFNGGIVFWINFFEGGSLGASVSLLIQLVVSGSLAGFTIPFSKNMAYTKGTGRAYFWGSFVMALFVATVGGIAH